MHKLVSIALSCLLVLGVSLTSGCGVEGSCAGGSNPVQCMNGWSQDECRDFDIQQVNGGDWTFSTSSCESRGFTKFCSNYQVNVLPSTSCN